MKLVLTMLPETHPLTTISIPKFYQKPYFQSQKTAQLTISPNNSTSTSTTTSRRNALFLSGVSIFLAKDAAFGAKKASAIDFRLMQEDQTLEEAENGIRGHAQSLLQVKNLLEAQSWEEAQKELRKNSSFLKQDMYTIIQGKPSSERPQLRKLYSTLFNSVSRLDYAARDKDVTRVWECYDIIFVTLNDILSRI